MKKNKNKNTAEMPEKGAATQEMEAIMDAAADDTAEIALLLDDGAPTASTTFPMRSNPQMMLLLRMLPRLRTIPKRSMCPKQVIHPMRMIYPIRMIHPMRMTNLHPRTNLYL